MPLRQTVFHATYLLFRSFFSFQLDSEAEAEAEFAAIGDLRTESGDLSQFDSILPFTSWQLKSPITEPGSRVSTVSCRSFV